MERDEQARREWQEQALGLDARKLVFVDEFGSHIGMSRLYARAPTGRRAYASLPRNRGPNTTLIASLRLDGLGEVMEVEGAVDGAVFEVYIEQVLGPTLEAGEVVVMDNLAVHKRERIKSLVEERGARVLFLPTYSPDLNPLEEAISKLKGLLRSAGARSKQALRAEITKVLDAITPQDALAYFARSGYLPSYHHL